MGFLVFSDIFEILVKQSSFILLYGYNIDLIIFTVVTSIYLVRVFNGNGSVLFN